MREHEATGECEHCDEQELAARNKAQRDLRLFQVGGDHYARFAIQPFDIIDCYNLSFYEGSALKYLLRYKHKNGAEDLRKAKHYIEVLIQKAEQDE